MNLYHRLKRKLELLRTITLSFLVMDLGLFVRSFENTNTSPKYSNTNENTFMSDNNNSNTNTNTSKYCIRMHSNTNTEYECPNPVEERYEAKGIGDMRRKGGEM